MKIITRFWFIASFLASSAHALTVTPASPYELSGTTVYYWAGGTPTVGGSAQFVDTAASFKSKSVTGLSSDITNAILLDIKSSQTITVGGAQSLVVSVLVKDTTDTYRTIPLRYSQATTGDPAACDGTTCREAIGNGYHSAVVVKDTTYRIGFYLHDLCAYLANVDGCAAGTATTPATNASQAFSFRIAVWAKDNGSTTDYASGGDSTDIQVVIHKMENQSVTCPPSDAEFASYYTPGDGEINVNPVAFRYAFTIPKSKLITVGSILPQSADRSYGTDFRNHNQLVKFNDASEKVHTISGFSNKTASSDNLYSIAFMFRDASGMVHFSTNTCAYSGIQTSTLQSFLNSDKCFISTLAYGSERHFFVKTLRAFRDRILLKSELGRKFTLTYYSVSPKMAMELAQYGWTRPALQVAFFPWMTSVWLMLNPWIALGFTLLCLAAYRMRKKLCGLR